MGRFIIKRRAGQKFLINTDISITVLKSTSGSTSLMIEMPDSKLITLVREEKLIEASSNVDINSLNNPLQNSSVQTEEKAEEQAFDSQQEIVINDSETKTQ